MPPGTEPPFNVFISWSGQASREVAQALTQWLPSVVPNARPFFSPDHIEKGTFWQGELTSTLSSMVTGIVCLTPENMQAEWILYEAGALSKSLGRGRLYTFLHGLSPSQVRPPLGMINHTESNVQDTGRLVHQISVHLANEASFSDVGLDLRFEALWPRLRQMLEGIKREPVSPAQTRSIESMVSELLDASRNQSKHFSFLAQRMEQLVFTLESAVSTSAAPVPTVQSRANKGSTGWFDVLLNAASVWSRSYALRQVDDTIEKVRANQMTTAEAQENLAKLIPALEDIEVGDVQERVRELIRLGVLPKIEGA